MKVRVLWQQLRSWLNGPTQKPTQVQPKATQVLEVGVDAVLAIRPTGIPSQAAVGTPPGLLGSGPTG